MTLGVTDITNGPHKWSELVPPKDIIIHENYSTDGDTALNDVALLRIRKTVFYGREFFIYWIRVVCVGWNLKRSQKIRLLFKITNEKN